MTKVNLIPAHRQAAQRLTHLVRRWAWGCAIYGAVLVVAFLAVRVAWSDGRDHLQRSLDDYKVRIERSTADTVRLRGELSGLSAELQAANAVGSQPDWSILMALITETLDEEIVLRTWRLSDKAPGASQRSSTQRQSGPGGRLRGAGRSTEPAATNELWLMLGGYGRNQPAVTQFVLRLEEEGIFSEVKLLDTQREPFLAEQAVAFRIGCALNTEPDPSDATP